MLMRLVLVPMTGEAAGLVEVEEEDRKDTKLISHHLCVLTYSCETHRHSASPSAFTHRVR